MAPSYTTNSGIEKPLDGEQTGSWGDTVNLNMDIIDRSLTGVGSITLSGTTHTLTTTDGTLTDGQYRVLVLGGTPSGTNTITVSPNDQTKLYFVVNNSGQDAVFTQGSGGNVTVANNTNKMIYADGAGAGAAVVDFTDRFAASNIDIDGGTIDATVIGGSSAAAATVTSLTTTGTVNANDLVSGTAVITSSANNPLTVTASDTSAAAQTVALFTTSSGGGAYLQVDDGSLANPTWRFYTYGSEDLSIGAGNAAGVTFDGSTNNATFAGELWIKTNASDTLPTLDASTRAYISANATTTDNANFSIISGTAGYSQVFFGDSADENAGGIWYYNADNSMSFRTNANSASLVLDNNQNALFAADVGIGGVTPAGQLHVYDGTSANQVVIIESSANTAYSVVQYRTNAGNWDMGVGGSSTASPDTWFLYDGANTLFTVDATSATFAGDVNLSAASGTIDLANAGNRGIYYDGTLVNVFSTVAGGDVQLDATDQVRFKTASTERMRIDSSGNVGIGTSSPSAKLDVNGTLSAGATTISTGSSGAIANANADELVLESNGNAGISILTPNTNTGIIYFADSDSERQAIIQYAHSTDEMSFYTNGTSGLALTIDSSQNVGIGIASPAAKLQVESSISHASTHYLNSDAQLLLRNTSGDSTARTVLKLVSSSSGNTSSIVYGNGSSTFTIDDRQNERMRIDSSGNVGIGTSSPAYALDVAGDIRTSSGALRVGATGGDTIDIFQVSGGGYLSQPGSRWLGFGTNNTERMRIDSSGNVGIGTSSPSAKLDVAGTLSASGDATVSRSAVGGTVGLTIQNSATSGASAARLQLDVSDSSTADPYVWWSTDSTNVYAGIDNDDSDKFKIGNSFSTPFVAFEKTTNNATFTGTQHILSQATPSYPPSGKGVEILYDGAGDKGLIQSYDRSGAAFKNLRFNAAAYEFNIGNATFGGNIGFSGSNPNILGNDDDGVLIVSGGIATNDGANLILYGGAHATLANDIQLRADATEVYRYDHSATKHVFSAAGSEIATITSSGNVGIGTSSPSSYDASANNLVVYENGNAGITIASNTTTSGSIYFADGTAGSEPYRGVVQYNHASDYMRFLTQAIERMRITSSGRVGIGTSSPVYLFDTYNSSTGTDYIAGRFYSAAAESGESRTWLKVEKASNFGGAIGGYLTQGVGSGLLLGTQNSSATPTERMRITYTGNVGIGTTSPAVRLHVSSGASNEVARFEGTNTPYISIYDTGVRQAYWIASTSIILRTENSKDLDIGTLNPNAFLFTTNNTERMRIDSSGNVGIGTSSPSAKLTVSGGNVRSDNGYNVEWGTSSVAAWKGYSGASGYLIGYTNGSERLRIESDGGVKVVNAAYNPPTTDNDLSFDQSATNNFTCTPTGSGTLTFTNHTAGQSGNILLDNSGGHAISLAATTKGDANLATTISTAGVYWLSYYDNGTNAYVTTSAALV